MFGLNRKFIGAGISLIFILGLAGCSENLFKASANQTSDDALLYEAQQKLDERDFEGAITLMDSLSTEYAAAKDVRLVRVSALAGACGLEFITFFTESCCRNNECCWIMYSR